MSVVWFDRGALSGSPAIEVDTLQLGHHDGGQARGYRWHYRMQTLDRPRPYSGTMAISLMFNNPGDLSAGCLAVKTIVYQRDGFIPRCFPLPPSGYILASL